MKCQRGKVQWSYMKNLSMDGANGQISALGFSEENWKNIFIQRIKRGD